jgi:hypothetical protein
VTPPRPRRLLWTRERAAEECEVSLSHFERYVQPHVEVVYWGQLRMIVPASVERLIADTATQRQAA